MAFRVSEPKWVGVWHARDSSGIKWAYRRSAIYPAILVELARQHRLKVMARKFRFRRIDNADRAPVLAQTFAGRVPHSYAAGCFDRKLKHLQLGLLQDRQTP